MDHDIELNDHNQAHQAAAPLVLLQMVSLAYLPISRGQLLQCLELAQARDDQGKPWNTGSLTPAIDALLAKGELQTQGGKLCCEPLMAEGLARQLLGSEQVEPMVNAIRTVFKIADYRYGYFVRQFNEGVRDLRLALYAGRFDDFSKLAQTIQSYFSAEWRSKNPYLTLFDNPFQGAQLDRLPADISLTVAATLLAVRLNRLESCAGPMSWLRDRARGAPEEQRQWFATILCEPMILRGHIDDAIQLSRASTSASTTPVQGLAQVLRGQMAEALNTFDTFLKESKKTQDLRKLGMAGWSGVAYVIALIATGDPKQLERASNHIAAVMKAGSPILSVYACLGHVARATQSVEAAAMAEEQRAEPPLERDFHGALFRGLSGWWIDGAGERVDQERMQQLARKAESQGYRWIAAEALELLGRMDLPSCAERAQRYHYEMGTTTLLDVIRRQPLWERALGALDRLKSDFEQVSPSARTTRFAWFLTPALDGGQCLLEAREQKRGPGQAWNLGKPVTINRMLTAQLELEGLTDQDRAVIAMIRQLDASKRGGERRVECMAAIALLVDHPHLFWAHEPKQSVQLLLGQPEIILTRERHQFHLRLYPSFNDQSRYLMMRETRHRLRMYELGGDQEKILRILGHEGLFFPRSAEERLKKTMESLSLRFCVRSDVGGGNIEFAPASGQIHALLSPATHGLELELMIYPQGDRGPAFTPGHGPEFLGEPTWDGVIQRGVLRDLEAERAAAEQVFQVCRPWLKLTDHPYYGHSLNAAMACELLVALRQMAPQVQLRWPEGEVIKIRGEAHSHQLALQIESQGEWLQVDGNVVVDQDMVVALRDLMQAAATPGTRFVALKDGQYLALSEQLLQRVRDLGGLSEVDDQLIRVHALAADQLAKIVTDNEGVITDPGWRALLERREALTLWQPDIPKTLNAVLRDYQIAGFQWLVRHAQSGAGACLADDMGLGKTLQTLCLLLYRASLGPALVVAPTSVCGNWESEAAKFAPSLRVRWITTGSRERRALEADAHDLFIMSYTLFQQETESLAETEWATVVLDEAQAIKNAGTKRSQAAMKINAQFRMITTGTPIENHLGELWNLFRFINPGLLGSLDSFTNRYAIPIEKNGDAEARERLRRLIQPFVLRRTKSQVLSELPQRTEVTLTLELNAQERAMYEAVRLEALESVTVLGEEQPNRIRVLAGIMKLRRACCHGSLILSDRSWASGKISTLLEIVEELRESGHRALVFSQFVDFLQIIRNALNEKSIHYQYLDGSTPSAERSRRVKAFQEGEGDLFLISLKAGGVGLNLTGADYVIHMDPWWNPAVEDQASDRAHRIGQTRPVTVYRLISRDTIEEKIVALHERKRNLADSLLSGAGEASTISTEELICLLQESQQ